MLFRRARRCICCGSRELVRQPAALAYFIMRRLGIKWQPKCYTTTCEACGATFLDLRYTDRQMAKLYRDYRSEEYNKMRCQNELYYGIMQQYLDLRPPYMNEIEALLEPLLYFPVSILDYGGNRGESTPFANKVRTLDVYDIGKNDVIDAAIKLPVNRPLRGGGYYDLIVCANLLEHVADPLAILRKLSRVMGKDTVLYIELPADNVQVHGWHEHINVFTNAGINRILARAGLYLYAADTVRVNVKSGKITIPIIQVLMAVKRKDTV